MCRIVQQHDEHTSQNVGTSTSNVLFFGRVERTFNAIHCEPLLTPMVGRVPRFQEGDVVKKASVVTVEVPEPLAAELAGAGQELLRDLLQRGLRDLHIEQALTRYREGGISFAAAAEFAGISQAELARAAHVRSMEPPTDQAMLDEELA